MARRFLLTTSLILMAALVQPVFAEDLGQIQFKKIKPQWIAALGDPNASSGGGAQNWGLWPLDPGPRGVWLKNYEALRASGGIAPAGWKFDDTDWWVEEHGLIMEKPIFPLPAGKYVVTGGRRVQAVLTVYPGDKNGDQKWELANGARLYDVTHLPCRSARYTHPAENNTCTPANAQQSDFPVSPGAPMPPVEGCGKQDYQVLIVIGVAAQEHKFEPAKPDKAIPIEMH